MYLDLLVLAVLLFPIWGVTAMIGKKAKPFSAIGMGAVFAGAGALIVMIGASSSGTSFSDMVDAYIKETVKILTGSAEYIAMLGEMGVKATEAESYLTMTYQTVAQLLPAMVLIVGAVVAYIEYNIIVRIRYRKVNGYKPLAYVRNFSLKSEDVLGWFFIYCIGYLLHIAGVAEAQAAVVNINILIEMVISLQGISFVMLIGHIKKAPKVLIIGIVAIGWMIPAGKTVLFVIGMIDLVFNLRSKLPQVK